VKALNRAALCALPIASSLLGAAACENDVSLQLLAQREPEAQPDAGSPDSGQNDASQVGVDADPNQAGCADGELCSGLGWALRFKGPYDRVEVPSSPLLDVPQDFALEAWVLVESYGAGHGVFNRWWHGVGDIQLTFGVPEPLPAMQLPISEPVPSHTLTSWSFVPAGYWLTVVAPSQPSTDEWHHIAVSYGGGSYRLYVDGAQVASADGVEPVANPPSGVFIGATARNERNYDGSQGPLYWPPIDGFIAEVRLSSGNRYPGDFTPESELSSDESTIALWHLDEGGGSEAVDSGPSRLHGSIHGAEWALAPRRGEVTAAPP